MGRLIYLAAALVYAFVFFKPQMDELTSVTWEEAHAKLQWVIQRTR